MTDHDAGDSFEGDITTEEALEAALGEVLRTALENGIDPRGSWVCRNDGTAADMEVLIHELEDGTE